MLFVLSYPRVSCDQIETSIRDLQKVPSILDVHTNTRVVKRAVGRLRVDHRVHFHDVPGDIDHVDALERL